MSTRTTTSLATLCIALYCLFAPPVSAEEKIDVSGVIAPNCRFCRGAGSVRCSACKGYGKSNSIPMPCERCKGEKTSECEHCDEEGMVDCKKCKLRKIEGEKAYAAPNPEYKEWQKKNGLKASQIFDPKKRDEILGERPVKYVPCPVCKAEGKAKCEKCEGSRKSPCSRCKGKGTMSGSGPCPKCFGCGKAPCQKCSTLEGFEENEQLAALLELRKLKTISDVDYFHKRRLLIAQELFRREKAGEKEKELVRRAKERGDKPEEVEAAAQPNWDKRKESLVALAKGADSGVLDFKSYRRKVQELGLPSAAVKDAESSGASDKMKKYLKLKKDFRNGKIDLTDFHEKMGQF